MSSHSRTRYSKRLTQSEQQDSGDKEDGNGGHAEEFDIVNFLKEVKDIESNVERSDDDRKAMEALDVTKAHFKRCCEDERIYIDALASIGK